MKPSARNLRLLSRPQPSLPRASQLLTKSSTFAVAAPRTVTDSQLSSTRSTKRNRSERQARTVPLLHTRNCYTTSASYSMSSSSTAPKDASDLRLPTDLKPTHYDLTVWTDLESNKFEGIVHVE